MMDMDMDMSTTTTAMPTSTASSDSIAGMDMSPMSMAEMSMGFFTSFRTTLYADSWTPASEGQYAGTCIFLIVLAVLLRFLIALKPILERRVWTDTPRSEISLIISDTSIEQAVANKHHGHQPGEPNIGRELASRWSNWKVNSAGGRATYEVIVAGVAYLLMLAVMTMNVGYFLSVLGGVWLGTFILGGLAGDTQYSH